MKNSLNFDITSQRQRDEDETTIAQGQNIDRGYISMYSSFIPNPKQLKMVAVGKKGLQTLAVLKKK